MDIEQLKLTDLVSTDAMQALQDSFSDATGMAAVTMDTNGFVTKWSNCSQLYDSFIKRLPKEHEDFFRKGLEESKRTGRPAVYSLHLGFTEFVVPIVIKGKYIGSVAGGHVLTEKATDTKVRKFCTERGFDSKVLTDLLNDLAIVPSKRVDAAADLMASMVSSLAESGYQSLLSAERARAAREQNGENENSEIHNRINSTVDLVKKVEDGCTSIKDVVSKCARAVDNTDSIVKTIESASTQLTLIGFNASIEAKRAGAAGVGFNVIAQEVRSLAEKNTKQAGEIGNTLGGIKKAMGDINNQFRGLYTDIELIVDSINELSCAVAEYEGKSE